jgi:hypothetical protein
MLARKENPKEIKGILICSKLYATIVISQVITHSTVLNRRRIRKTVIIIRNGRLKIERELIRKERWMNLMMTLSM